MTRWATWLSLFATLIIAGLIGFNIVREPARREAAQTAYHEAALANATDIYAHYCAECHGAAGEGLGIYRALNQEYVQGQDFHALFSTIERGRYNTEMAGFAMQEGGPLTHQQINDLVLLLQTGPWDAVAARVEALGLTPQEAPAAAVDVPPALETALAAAAADLPQTLAAAESRFAEHCAECHGEDGIGTGDAPQLNTPYIANMPAGQLYERIALGVRFTDMEGFADQFTDAEIAELITLLQHWGGAAPGAALAAAPTPTIDTSMVTQSGQQLFETWCAICHGVRGEGGSIAPSLNDIPHLPADFLISRVRGGKNAMPPFSPGDISDAELWVLIEYAQSSIIGSGLPAYTPEEIAAGQMLYTQHCAECHGPQGEGTPDSGPRLHTIPPMRAIEIANFVRVGSTLADPIPDSDLPDSDLRLIIGYLHSLR